ncbi:MAG: hypothetical protein K0R28_5979, partial [Paenibacillus sp.]|nr:hypothetical protein [Paenibacillus sp.]
RATMNLSKLLAKFICLFLGLLRNIGQLVNLNLSILIH